jgi:hypothetical protein
MYGLFMVQMKGYTKTFFGNNLKMKEVEKSCSNKIVKYAN